VLLTRKACISNKSDLVQIDLKQSYDFQGGRLDLADLIRSFVAFDIENGRVLGRFSEIQGLILKTGADLKVVQPGNIHITIRFLGNISLGMVELVHEAMKEVPFVPFDVDIEGLGAFPNLRHANIVWAGIGKGANELKSIFDQLEFRLRALGLKPDLRGFSPHLTLVRVRTGRHKAELMQIIQDLRDYEFGTIKAICLKLKKSVLTPKGPIYSTLKEVCR
jgi:2'-5' RNA ligase